jgi:hypothetical protein
MPTVMRRRLSLGALLVLLVAPAGARAAHFDAPPPPYDTSGVPFSFTVAPDGQSAASGVAYKLSSEAGWHRCLAPGTVTLALPAGDYTVQIADDTDRAWFDENEAQASTPECAGATAPAGRAITTATFYVRDAPKPAPKAVRPADPCGDELARVARLHRAAETARARYRRRRTKTRRRASTAASSKYAKARRAYDRHC